jgi:hypothetical protein
MEMSKGIMITKARFQYEPGFFVPQAGFATNLVS